MLIPGSSSQVKAMDEFQSHIYMQTMEDKEMMLREGGRCMDSTMDADGGGGVCGGRRRRRGDGRLASQGSFV